MDATSEDVLFPVKVLLDREKNKIVLAEAGSDFIDTLLSFLTLPMGTIIRILKTDTDLQLAAVGSFTSLYESIEKLHVKHLWSKGCKELLLNPRNGAEKQCVQLKLNMDDSVYKCFFCENWECTTFLSFHNTARCSCGKLMNRFESFKTEQSKGGVFVTETASFIISDDLHVCPNSTKSAFELLKTYRDGDLDVADEMNLSIGFKEMLNLLKCSLLSNSPLTDVFLKQQQNIPRIITSESAPMSKAQICKVDTPESRMTIKLVLQKSRNKILFAESEENFVEFLFSLLTIPLGGVVRLLSSDSSASSIGNLYSSVSLQKTQKYIKSEELKEILLNPQLAPLHLCKNNIFCLQAKTPNYCICHELSNSQKRSKLTLINPKVAEEYIRSPASFMVTDDLVVSPLSSISGVSFLQRSRIPLSDVEEQVICIGIDDVICYLAFTSREIFSYGGKLAEGNSDIYFSFNQWPYVPYTENAQGRKMKIGWCKQITEISAF